MVAGEVSAERAHGALIGARRAADTEIDAAGIESGERSELLGDDQRRMVRQHDAARADADGVRCPRDMADHDRGGRARDARHVVMFGEPEPAVAPRFGMTGEIDAVSQGGGCVAALDDGRKIENGERDHAPI